jgi:hypothetical protein
MPDNPSPGFRVGLNPLPWVLTPDGFQLTEPVPGLPGRRVRSGRNISV